MIIFSSINQIHQRYLNAFLMRNQTLIFWNFPYVDSQGLRGLAINTVKSGPTTNDFRKNIDSNWQGIKFLESTLILMHQLYFI